MKVLQLCSKIPFPAKDGGCLAMLNLAEMLHREGNEVKILAIETHKHPAPIKGYPENFKKKFAPESVLINTKTRLWNALKNLIFSNDSYHLSRFKNKQFELKLTSVILSYQPDIVIFDSLFTCGYIHVIKLHSNAKIIYRAHNIEFIIWQEIAKKTRSYFKRKYLHIQSQRLKKEEINCIAKCDGILAITANDSLFFSTNFYDKKLMTLPFTIDITAYNCNNDFHQKSIFFIGAMDWYPNLEGINWFINKVWDKIIQQHPTAKFYLAGKAMPEDLKQLEAKNIINLGEVEDAKKFMGTYPMMIAPIFSGGGLKIKIVEAMAMGKIVICNPEAASGIPVTNKKNILFASSPQDFIEVINDCLAHLSLQQSIGEHARLLIEKQFNSIEKGKELNLFIKSI